MGGHDTFHGISPLTACTPLAKKKRAQDGIKILLDVAKESADWFPPLKSALGGVSALIRHYEVSVEWIALRTADAGDGSNSKMSRRSSRISNPG